MENEKKQNQVEHHEHQERRRFEDHDSGSTVHGNNPEDTLGQGNVPEVDTKYASEIKVSKLRGKWLTWMVSISVETARAMQDLKYRSRW
jgi:hypothetical protein